MNINRLTTNLILEDIENLKNSKATKIIILYGPRRVGKTTLVNEIITKLKTNSKYLDCTDPRVREILQNQGIDDLKSRFEDLDLLVLDEAQLVINIGQTLKLFADHFNNLQVIATGSSSFELSNQIVEPLTGRHHTYYLYPISYLERYPKKDILWPNGLENWLIYGSYPTIITEDSVQKKQQELNLLTSDYLFKDILALENIKNSNLLRNLLEALALQLGSEVSYTELGNLLGVSKNTVEKYIDLLEKSYIIFKLHPLSKNPRKEISKTKKIYFYDLGIRNTLIRNLNPLKLRQDSGALWENFCIIERLKANRYQQRLLNSYFWRTYSQVEIDYIEEHSGKLFTFEFKINKIGQIILPRYFADFYKNNSPTIHTVNSSNFDKWIRE